jgi:hypothetical protein
MEKDGVEYRLACFSLGGEIFLLIVNFILKKIFHLTILNDLSNSIDFKIIIENNRTKLLYFLSKFLHFKAFAAMGVKILNS